MKTKKTFSASLFCLLMLIYLPEKMLSQNFTNRGNDFWVAHAGHIDGTGSTFILYISASVNTTGTVSVPLQGWSAPFTIAANSIVTITVPSSVGYVGCSDCIKPKGIHIVSDNDVAIYAQIYAPARADASLILPTKVLGKEYYAMCMTQYGGEYSEFTVAAVEDSTKLEITPTSLTLGGSPANVPFIITLQQGEVYQVKSLTDLTGSKITAISTGSAACKKVAVFSGSTWDEPGCGGTGGSGDNLFEQMYPTSAWGKNFITSPLKTRIGGDLFRVMADSNATTVTINGTPVVLNQAQFYDIQLTAAGYFTADKPIALAEYARSSGCDGVTGDPCMIILNPVEQTVNNVLVYSTSNATITGEYINAVMKTADIGTFLLDGASVTFNPVPSNPVYSYSQNTVTVGTHTLIADSGFNAIAYGFGSPEAYGYLAGANVKNLQQSLSVTSAAGVVSNFVCRGNPLVFNGHASYTPVSWKWNFGDGTTSSLQNDIHTYADTGTYIVSLITVKSGTGCDSKDSSSSTLLVSASTANFSSAAICFGNAAQLIDASLPDKNGTLRNWLWDFGDSSAKDTASSPSHTYAVPGTYSVKLVITSNRGCKDSITKNTITHPLPVVYFNALDVCDQNVVHFNDFSSILPTDTIQSWRWNYADGSPRVLSQNTSHLYALSGSYSVQLKVVSNFGCSDSINKTIIVHPSPVCNFKNTRVCQGIATQFTDTSTTAIGSITGWSWNYGDSSILGTIQNPSRLYAGGGIYNVTLIAANNFGCADTITKPVRVYYIPAADFSYVDVCYGDSLRFTNISTITPPDSISSYLWVFGDSGPTGSTASPAHYYSQSGTYNVILLSTTSNGCNNAMTHAVKAYDAPQSAFSKNNICLFDSVLFNNTTIPPFMGSTAGWTWDYGDNSGLNTTAWNPVHHYSSPGSYQVTLITRSSNLGCADTLKDSIIVYPMPTAGYSFNNVCLNQPINFNDSSRISSGSITVHSWNFGDGTSPNGNPDPGHLYANAGTYPVTLIVTSSFGCRDTIVKNTVIHPLPHAHIYAKDVCNGITVQFADSSNIAPSDTIHSWRWNFADTSPLSISKNTSHLYNAIGAYPVQLYITSNFGCLDSITRTITINPNPQVNFSSSDSIGCEPLCVTFHNTSAIASGTNTLWSWDFGDGNPSEAGQNPYHCYNNDSVFAPNLLDVTLTVTSDSGCISTKTKNHYITVYPAPIAGFSTLPGAISIVNPEITITDQSAGGNYWHWNFGDQDTASIRIPAPHTYADTGTYRITQIVSTQYSCIDTAYQTVIIEPDFLFYIPNSFSPNDDGINDIFSGKGIFIKEYEMMIFDRWGNLIFYSNDAAKGWDGRANHGTETAQRDVYVYTFKITDFNKRKHSYKGIVTLVK